MIYGLWNGGHSYAPSEFVNGSGTTDLEVFEDLDDAKDAMRGRIHSGHWQPQTFTFADGRTQNVLTPTVTGSWMFVYYYDPREVGDPYPDLLLEQTDDDEIKEETT